MERTLPGLGQTVVTSYAHAKKFKELRTKEAHDSEVKELAKNLFKDSERARKPKKRRMQCPEGGTVTPDGHIIRVAQTRRPLRAHWPAAALLRLGVKQE
jgi:hypothetical protein